MPDPEIGNLKFSPNIGAPARIHVRHAPDPNKVFVFRMMWFKRVRELKRLWHQKNEKYSSEIGSTP